MNKIKSLYLYIKDKENNRNNKIKSLKPFCENAASFLFNGTYYLDFKRKIIFNKHTKQNYSCLKNNVFLNYLFHKKTNSTFLKKIIDRYFDRNYKFKVKKKSDLSSYGSIALLGSINNDFKIFNYSDMKAFSVFEDSRRADYIIGKRKLLSTFGFNVLDYSVINSSNETVILEEPLISAKPYEHDSIFPKIIGFYNAVHSKQRPGILESSDIYIQLMKDFMINANNIDICNHSLFLKQMAINNRCLQCCHGDFHYFNYVYDGRNYLFIDFEYVDFHIFFYDIFFYIFFEAYRLGNFIIWQNLLNGDYDEQLSILFNTNGFEYAREDNCLYLLFVVFDFYDKKIPEDVNTFLLRSLFKSE